MATIRRDTLRKRAQAGKLIILNYRKTTEDEYTIESDINLPVHVFTRYESQKTEHWNICEDEFSTVYGGAYSDDHGLITLYTGYGSTYCFRLA